MVQHHEKRFEENSIVQIGMEIRLGGQLTNGVNFGPMYRSEFQSSPINEACEYEVGRRRVTREDGIGISSRPVALWFRNIGFEVGILLSDGF